MYVVGLVEEERHSGGIKVYGRELKYIWCRFKKYTVENTYKCVYVVGLVEEERHSGRIKGYGRDLKCTVESTYVRVSTICQDWIKNPSPPPRFQGIYCSVQLR